MLNKFKGYYLNNKIINKTSTPFISYSKCKPQKQNIKPIMVCPDSMNFLIILEFIFIEKSIYLFLPYTKFSD